MWFTFYKAENFNDHFDFLQNGNFLGTLFDTKNTMQNNAKIIVKLNQLRLFALFILYKLDMLSCHFTQWSNMH